MNGRNFLAGMIWPVLSGAIGLGQGFVLFTEFFFDVGFRLDPPGGDAGPHDQALGVFRR